MNSRRDNDTLYLIPETQLVASSIERVRDFFAAELKENFDVSKVILDVHGIDIIDSLGVNLIIGVYREVRSKSGTFEIIGAGEKFMKVAVFFKFQNLFNIRETKGD